jgi:hypothetical protein
VTQTATTGQPRQIAIRQALTARFDTTKTRTGHQP